jgi:hypothetical protein
LQTQWILISCQYWYVTKWWKHGTMRCQNTRTMGT